MIPSAEPDSVPPWSPGHPNPRAQPSLVTRIHQQAGLSQPGLLLGKVHGSVKANCRPAPLDSAQP